MAEIAKADMADCTIQERRIWGESLAITPWHCVIYFFLSCPRLKSFICLRTTVTVTQLVYILPAAHGQFASNLRHSTFFFLNTLRKLEDPPPHPHFDFSVDVNEIL